MQKVVFTSLSEQDLHALVVHAVNVCLRTQNQTRQDIQPGEAGQPIAKKPPKHSKKVSDGKPV